MRHRFLAALTASASFAMLLTSVHISLADVIDGDWCRADGKRMKIRGPEIVTPGGNQTRGDYTRHSFSYVIPAGEAGAGENVSIILLSEYLAHARQGSDTAPVQVWNRCPPGVAESRPALVEFVGPDKTCGTRIAWPSEKQRGAGRPGLCAPFPFPWYPPRGRSY